TVCFTDLEGQGVVLDAGLTDGIYTWSTGDTSQVLEVFQGGTYMVTVTNGFQCIDADTVTITNECFSSIWFPKAFTPNDDLLNDGFRGFGDNIDNYHLMIFNRWGEMLYDESGLHASWDGLGGNGESYPQGIYTYRIYYRDANGVSKELIGNVTIVSTKPRRQ
ncbi:MAG: gliding motility-associated C-terminal domain-containing protein, partial [Bacteroidota bacterium]